MNIAATASDLALELRTSGRTVLKPGGVPISFTGAGGNWSVAGHMTGKHSASVRQPMTADAAGRVLVLLEGGMLRFGGAAANVPRLRVPASAAAGRAWFDCVQQALRS